jgi:hypothetical protein
MDWFKGNFTGKLIFNGKNHGFRLRFSQQDQSIDTTWEYDGISGKSMEKRTSVDQLFYSSHVSE